jgi:hypothetical protein
VPQVFPFRTDPCSNLAAWRTRGHRSGRNGVIDHNPTLALSEPLLDPGDIAGTGCREIRSANTCAPTASSRSSTFPASKLHSYAYELSQMLRQRTGKSIKQKWTVNQQHADLAAFGCDRRNNNRVAAFARDWKAVRQQEQKTCGRGVSMPMAFFDVRGVSVRLVGGLSDHRRLGTKTGRRSLQALLQPRLHSPGLSAADPRAAV